jgi:hypothetical protein
MRRHRIAFTPSAMHFALSLVGAQIGLTIPGRVLERANKVIK